MPVNIRAEVAGADELAAYLRALEPKLFRGAARKAVDDAAKVVVAEAKANVPQRTGSLRKALGKKVVALKSGKGYVAVVGPRRDVSAKAFAARVEEFKVGKRKRMPRTGRFRRIVKFQGKELLVNPAKYAHLVEYGRRSVTVRKKKVLSGGGIVYGKKTAPFPARPFMRPAWAKALSKARAMLRSRMAEAALKAAKGKGK